MTSSPQRRAQIDDSLPRDRHTIRSLLSLSICLALTVSCGKLEETPAKKTPALSVVPSMDNRFVPGRWSSATVIIEGGNEARAGRLGLSCSDEAQRTAVSYLDLKVPARSRKIYRLPVRPVSGLVSVWFNSGRKREAVEITLMPAGGSAKGMNAAPAGVVLVCGRGLQRLRSLTADEDYVIIPAEPLALPEVWYSLESVSTLVTTPDTLDQLNVLQKEALVDWVGAGGRIVLEIRPGVGFPKSEALYPLLRGEVIGTASLPRTGANGEAGGTPLVFTMFRDVGGHVAVRTGETPVAIEYPVGLGSAVLLAVPVVDPVLYAGGTGARPIARVLNPRPAGVACSLLGAGSDSFSFATGKMKHVPAKTAFILLFWYLVLVGPVDYLVLRAIRRLEWTWYTFAVISAIATVLALVWVYRTKEGAFTAVTTAAVMTAPDGVTRTVAFTDLYCQKSDTYSFSAKGRSALKAVGSALLPKLISAGTYRLRSDDGFNLESYYIPIWTHLMLRTDLIEHDPGPAGGSAVLPVALAGGSTVRTHSWEFDLREFDTKELASARAASGGREFPDEMHGLAAQVRATAPALPQHEYGFLTAVLAEYEGLTSGSPAAPGPVMIERAQSGYVPFSVQGGTPETTCVTYVITPSARYGTTRTEAGQRR